MPTAVKALLSTFFALAFVIGFTFIEATYTHGALTVIGITVCLVVMVFLMFYAILSD